MQRRGILLENIGIARFLAVVDDHPRGQCCAVELPIVVGERLLRINLADDD